MYADAYLSDGTPLYIKTGRGSGKSTLQLELYASLMDYFERRKIMLEKFLEIINDGYQVTFESEGYSAPCTVITVGRYGRSASHTVNLNGLKEFGMDKDVAILATIEKLKIDLTKYEAKEEG